MVCDVHLLLEMTRIEEKYPVHKWANDYDSDTCKTYTRNICKDFPETVYCEDVHTLDIDKLGEIDWNLDDDIRGLLPRMKSDIMIEYFGKNTNY